MRPRCTRLARFAINAPFSVVAIKYRSNIADDWIFLRRKDRFKMQTNYMTKVCIISACVRPSVRYPRRGKRDTDLVASLLTIVAWMIVCEWTNANRIFNRVARLQTRDPVKYPLNCKCHCTDLRSFCQRLLLIAGRTVIYKIIHVPRYVCIYIYVSPCITYRRSLLIATRVQ